MPTEFLDALPWNVYDMVSEHLDCIEILKHESNLHEVRQFSSKVYLKARTDFINRLDNMTFHQVIEYREKCGGFHGTLPLKKWTVQTVESGLWTAFNNNVPQQMFERMIGERLKNVRPREKLLGDGSYEIDQRGVNIIRLKPEYGKKELETEAVYVAKKGSQLFDPKLRNAVLDAIAIGNMLRIILRHSTMNRPDNVIMTWLSSEFAEKLFRRNYGFKNLRIVEKFFDSYTLTELNRTKVQDFLSSVAENILDFCVDEALVTVTVCIQDLIKIKKVVCLILPSIRNAEFRDQLTNMWEWPMANQPNGYTRPVFIEKTSFDQRIQVSCWPQTAKMFLKKVTSEKSLDLKVFEGYEQQLEA